MKRRPAFNGWFVIRMVGYGLVAAAFDFGWQGVLGAAGVAIVAAGLAGEMEDAQLP